LDTLKFQGWLQGVMVKILVNSGSNDNFIQPRIAHFLKLPIEPAPQFKVLVRNDSTMTAEGCVKDI